MWDQRDFELNLRERLAQVVAEIISGAEGAIPEQFDYEIADSLRSDIEAYL